MPRRNEYLLSPDRLCELLAEAASPAGRDALWKAVGEPAFNALEGNDTVDVKTFDVLTPGQAAAACAWSLRLGADGRGLYRWASQDWPTVAARTPGALDTLGAAEYAALVREAERVFPGGRFPQYAEDMMRAFRQGVHKKFGALFSDLSDRVLSGKGMSATLGEYVAAYVTAHPGEFSGT